MASEQSTTRIPQMPSGEIDHALTESEWYALGYWGLRNITPFSDRLLNALDERYQRHIESRGNAPKTEQRTLALATDGGVSEKTGTEVE